MDIKRLPGWMTFRDASAELGYNSRQAFHLAVWQQHIFTKAELSYVNIKRGDGTQPLYLVTTEAVARVKAARLAAKASRELAVTGG